VSDRRPVAKEEFWLLFRERLRREPWCEGVELKYLPGVGWTGNISGCHPALKACWRVLGEVLAEYDPPCRAEFSEALSRFDAPVSAGTSVDYRGHQLKIWPDEGSWRGTVALIHPTKPLTIRRHDTEGESGEQVLERLRAVVDAELDSDPPIDLLVVGE